MNWFERHLNWSLLFVDILLPFIVGMIWVIVFFSILGGLMMSMQGVEKSPEFIGTLFSSFLPVALISVLVSIGITIFQIVTTLWYLGKKGRSKGLIILIIVPWVFTFILAFFNAARIGEILGGLGYIAGVIILLLLENQSVGYDADFVRELEADRWQDTGQFGMSDDRQYKELDYRYVEDASDVSPAGGEIPAPPPAEVQEKAVDKVPVEAPAAYSQEEATSEAPAEAIEESPAAAAEIQEEAPAGAIEESSAEALEEAPAEAIEESPAEALEEAPAEASEKLPAEATAAAAEIQEEAPVEAIEESYAEALEEVPAEAIEESPAEALEEAPVEAIEESPAEIPAAAAAAAQVTETISSQPMSNAPLLLDDTGAVLKCFYHPEADAVNSCSRCGQYVCSQCNYVTGTHPICRNCWERRGEKPISAAGLAKKPQSPKLEQPGKKKAGEDERSREFVLLYEQALPFISAVVTKSPDGLPASPLDLMEGLKLRPMLQHAKKLPKPKDKELQEAKKTFEQLLEICVKVGEAAADFVTAGGQKIPTEANFARLADGVEKASGLMGQLYQRMSSFSQAQG